MSNLTLNRDDFTERLQIGVNHCIEGKQSELCAIMTKHGSDKGNKHNYSLIYSQLFERSRFLSNSVFEIGIGTNRPEVISNMGPEGKPGASLRGWAEWMPNARVWGGDIDRSILFSEERIETVFMDQLDERPSRFLPPSPALFDIIIDDGLHDPPTNLMVMRNLFSRLKPGGVYVIEDLISHHPLTEEIFGKWNSERSPSMSNYLCAFLRLPHAKNKYDNNMFVVLRLA